MCRGKKFGGNEKHWMRAHTDDSDVKLYKYTLHILNHPLFLYREEYPDGTMSWFVGLF